MIGIRYRLPLKVALALTLAIVSALWLGWEKPYWAAFSVVVMAVTESTGHSLKKGRQRIIGTLFGVFAAFVFIGLFAQQPVELIACYSLFSAVCVYQQTNVRNGYAWSIGMMVATIVMVMGGLSGEQTFTIAVLRIQETLLGVLCFSLVFSLLWPVSSRTLLLETLRSYYQQQATIVGQILSDLEETSSLQRDYSLGNSIKRLSRLQDLIQAAMADSYELSSNSLRWQQLLKQQNQWILLCGHLYEATRLLNAPLSAKQKNAVSGVLQHLQQRAQSASELLSYLLEQASWEESAYLLDKRVNPIAQAIDLPHDGEQENQSHGALGALAKILSQMDEQHQQMQATLFAALGLESCCTSDNLSDLAVSVPTTQPDLTDLAVSVPTTQPDLTVSVPVRKVPVPTRVCRWVALDPERVIHVLKFLLMLWITIALWLYVPMPGGPMIVLFGGAFGAVILSMPFASTRSLLFYMLGWAGVVLLQYVFVLPHLNEVWQLAGFYFINSFVIWFVFYQPQQIFHRLLGTMNLVLMTNSAMKLTPSYDIQYSLQILLLFSVGMLVIFFINHGVFSANPERVFLRQLSHFRRSLQANLDGLLSRNKRLHIGIVSPVPVAHIASAEAAIGMIDWSMYPELEKGEAEQLIARAYSLCLHYRAFSDSYAQWQSCSFHSGIDNLVQSSIEEMIRLLNKSMICEDNWQHAVALRHLQLRLKLYRYGLDHHSPLQITFSQQQADLSYQLLVSMQILLESLQQLQQETSGKQFYALRLSPYAI